MLTMYKNKGVTLVELMVALSLGILLTFSMLAFYSITQNNLVAHAAEQKRQQELRKLFHLLSRNIENTGAFECADPNIIFRDPGSMSNLDIAAPANNVFRENVQRFPKNIISLGSWEAWNTLGRQQIMFVHPIEESNLDRSLGMVDVQVNNNVTTAHYSPIEVPSNCGDYASTIYVGTTIVETVPLNAAPPITSWAANRAAAADVASPNVTALIVMSGLQPRLYNMMAANVATDGIKRFQNIMTKNYDRGYFLQNFRLDNSLIPQVPGAGSEAHRLGFASTIKVGDEVQNPGKNQFTFSYLPSIYDGTVAYLSDGGATGNLPFGQTQVVISLGFADSPFSFSVPAKQMVSLDEGGWLNPYASVVNYNLIMETCNNGGYKIDGCSDGPPSVTIENDNVNTQLINRVLHPATDADGAAMRTYPISEKAAERVRAVRFTFTLNAGTPNAQVINRVIRFKSTHLKQLND